MRMRCVLWMLLGRPDRRFRVSIIGVGARAVLFVGGLYHWQQGAADTATQRRLAPQSWAINGPLPDPTDDGNCLL